MDKKIITTLPSRVLIAGETLCYDVKLCQDTGETFSLGGIKAELSISPYGVSNNPPIVVIKGKHENIGIDKIIRFKIDIKDTVTLSGQYRYQISLKDTLGNTEIYQGDLTILPNISQSFLEIQ